MLHRANYSQAYDCEPREPRANVDIVSAALPRSGSSRVWCHGRGSATSGLGAACRGAGSPGPAAGSTPRSTGHTPAGELHLLIIIIYLSLSSLNIIICSAGRRQPDNREGNEFCVGVLNNFYNDGVRFHDIACHHRKPIICEQ